MWLGKGDTRSEGSKVGDGEERIQFFPKLQCSTASSAALALPDPSPDTPIHTYTDMHTHEKAHMHSLGEGLTNRLFSKTLSLESESKSLQEAKRRDTQERVRG